MIEFILKEQPHSQKRHRSTRTGRMYDPSAKDKKKTQQKMLEFKPKELLATELLIKIIFTFKRPKSHYRTGKSSHILKTNQPEYHSFTPDIDNCCKYYMDCMNKMFYVDDSQICMLQAEKYYGKNPSVEIIIEEI
tara:strand:- start:4481 stop:4885 length:405 start_codon:yes stop_codon:yes gene_type:complete